MIQWFAAAEVAEKGWTLSIQHVTNTTLIHQTISCIVIAARQGNAELEHRIPMPHALSHIL
jgi:hypothetical protein